MEKMNAAQKIAHFHLVKGEKLECIEPIQPGIVFLLSAQLVILWDFY